MSDSEDEVDILGELPSPPSHNVPLSSYSELLKCDYTIHPQWLLDSTTTACWYDNPQQDEILTEMATDSDEEQHKPSTSSQIIQWTNNEKKMLHKGMEIYGQDPQRLSIFIGTKNPSEIRLFIESEYGINLESAVYDVVSEDVNSIPQQNIHAQSNEYGDVLADNEIPASMEEVICMFNTAEPTVPNKPVFKSGDSKSNIKKIVSPDINSRSLLKKSSNKIQSPSKLQKSEPAFVDSISVINEVCKKDVDNLLFGIPKKSTKSNYRRNMINVNSLEKFSGSSSFMEDKLYIELDCDKLHSIKRNKKSKFSTSALGKSSNLSRLVGKQKNIKNVIKQKNSKSKHSTNSLHPMTTSLMEIVTGSGQALPLSEGEQVIKIEKCVNSEAESDIEIDVDSDNDTPTQTKMDFNSIETCDSEIVEDSLKTNSKSSDTKLIFSDTIESKHLNIPVHLRGILESLDLPLREYFIKDNEISDLEKALYPEFFEGKVSKTPERYMLIRSHIINCWNQCRPLYLTKTAVRQGLKNGGDVNCIGRIHTIMEQIGAINFGCEQTSYTRPLLDLLNPSNIQQTISETTIGDSAIKYEMLRQRKKKLIVDGVGGYTITHTESGEFYEAISEPKQQRSTKKKPIVNLIYCKVYNDEQHPPYFVQISLSALILMDVHSYMSRAEVMGLLGGHYMSDNIVTMEKYIPCDSLEDSGTHCDMCPVSQSAATESLSASGYETIGWHHSHPLFPPQPSAQDILSQADFQTAFSPRPFLAVIISPYWPPGRTSSQFRCFITKKETSKTGDYDVPYRLKTHLLCDLNDRKNVDFLLAAIEEIRHKNMSNSGKYTVDMNEVCKSTNITFLEKCLSSVKHHLSTCDIKLDPEISHRIINGISNIFN